MKWLFFLLAVLYGHLPFAHALEPYSGSRIFWDTASRRTVFSGGGYARIIELQDGRLMAVCESGGIKITVHLAYYLRLGIYLPEPPVNSIDKGSSAGDNKVFSNKISDPHFTSVVLSQRMVPVHQRCHLLLPDMETVKERIVTG